MVAMCVVTVAEARDTLHPARISWSIAITICLVIPDNFAGDYAFRAGDEEYLHELSSISAMWFSIILINASSSGNDVL